MSNDEFRFSEDLDSISAEFDKQLSRNDSEKTAQALKKARVFCIRERFDEALKIYESIVDEDIECVAGYIGILRVHSKDYTVYDGAEIEKDLKIISKIGDGSEADDDEYVDYLKKRKEYLSKKTAAPATPVNSSSEKTAPVAPSAPAATAKPTLPDGILSKEEAVKLYEQKKYDVAFPSLLYYAEQGDMRCQHATGYCYFYGEGVKGNNAKAVSFYKKAAEQGYIRSYNSLGVCYESGYGVKKDCKKAVELYLKAAEQGNDVAQFNMGMSYEFGSGVEKNIDKAIYWYEKAAAQNHQRAKAKLAKLKK